MEYSFAGTWKKAEKQYGLGKTEAYKVQEGSNKVRILSPAIPFESEFKGKPSIKFVCWVLDRKEKDITKQVKLYYMPSTVMKAIADLQTEPEYTFTEVPMPYDIDIKTENAGKTEARYSIIPSRNSIPLTIEEMNQLTEKTYIVEVARKLEAKQGTAPRLAAPVEQKEDIPTIQDETDDHIETGIKVEDIPF